MTIQILLRRTVIATTFLFLLPHSGAAANEEMPLILWYQKPASGWGNALALGNGRLGAMVFGGTEQERIGLNEDTLWSGGPYEPSTEASKETRDEIRLLLFDGKYGAAQNLSNKLQGTPNTQNSYQTVGEIQLDFPGHSAAKNYRRQLDLNTATVTVTYEQSGVKFTRETFVSPVDQVVVVRLTADKPGKIEFTTTYSSPMKEIQVSAEGNYLRLTGKNEDLMDRSGKNVAAKAALNFESRTRVISQGGKTTAADGKVTVTGADSVTLLIASATNFKRYDDISGDPAAAVSATLQALGTKPYEKVLADHIAAHQKLFGRVKIDLGRTPSADLPTDERVRNYAKEPDPALVALHFQFGRYLLISCSRPGSQPANLQGLWNDQLKAPWGG
ncbi:MAG: glycoside hydrolase family 95 protein, partial [Luteolibacter sp.]